MQHKQNNLQSPLTAADTTLTSEVTDVISDNNNLITNTNLLYDNVTGSCNDKLYFCSICKKQTKTYKDWNNHKIGRKHRQIEKIGNVDADILDRILSMQKKFGSSTVHFDVDMSDPISFKCNLCDTNVFNENDLLEHLTCSLHKTNKSKFHQPEKYAVVGVEINNAGGEENGEFANCDNSSSGSQSVTSSFSNLCVNSDHPTNTNNAGGATVNNYWTNDEGADETDNIAIERDKPPSVVNDELSFKVGSFESDFRIDLHALSESASKSDETNDSQKDIDDDDDISHNDTTIVNNDDLKSAQYHRTETSKHLRIKRYAEKKPNSHSTLISIVNDSLMERCNNNHQTITSNNNNSINDAVIAEESVCEANSGKNDNALLSFERNSSERKTRNNLRANAVNSLSVSREVLNSGNDTNANSTDNNNDNSVLHHCSTCRKHILSSDWASHVNGKKHQRNEQMSTVDVAVLKHIRAVKAKLGPRNRFFYVENTPGAIAFKCNLCETSLRSEKDIDQHLICKYHKMAVSKYYQTKRRAKRFQTYNNSDADDDQQQSVYTSLSLSSDLCENDSPQEAIAAPDQRETISAGLCNAEVVEDVNNNHRSLPFAENGNDRGGSYNDSRDNVAAYEKPSSQPLDKDTKSANYDELTESAAMFDRFEGELICNVCHRKISFRHDALLAHTKVCVNSRSNNREIQSVDSDRIALHTLKRYLMSIIDSSLEEYITKHEINVKRLMQFRCTFSNFAYHFYQSENGYRIRKLLCQPCLLTVTDDVSQWIEHMCGPDHCLMYSGVKLSCYFCAVCSVYMYASDAYVKSHALQCLAKYPFFAESLFTRDILTNNVHRIAIETFRRVTDRGLICCCVACNLCTEDVSHLSSEHHKTKQILFCDIFLCETCSVIFYCDRDTYNNHTLSIYHIRRERCNDNKSQPVVTVNECVSSINSNSLHDDVFTRLYVKSNSSLRDASSLSIATYFCKPCNQVESTQLDWNLHVEKARSHYSRLNNSASKFAEYVCLACSAVIFSTLYDYIGHCHSEYHRKFNDFVSRNVDLYDSTVFNYLSRPSEKGACDFLDSFNDSSSENHGRFRKNDNVKRLNDNNDSRRTNATVVDRKENLLDVALTDKSLSSDDRTKLFENIDGDYNNGNNNGGRNRNEQILEKHLIIRGIPVKMLRNRRQVVQILSTFGLIKRTYIRKGSPTALYVVAGERTYQKIQANVQTLRNDFKASGLKFTFTERTAFVNSPIINTNLSPEVVSLFSDLNQLGSIIASQILHAEEESKSIIPLTKIKDLQKSLIKYAENIFDEEYIRSYVFGSRVTGLASLQSDIDIFLDIGGSFRGIMDRSAVYQKELVKTFAIIMRKNSNEFGNIVPIPSARVPIVKFYHIPTKLHCDLSFKSGMSTLNSMLVRFYLNLDVRVKNIINAVKLWAYHNELSDRFLFTTYGIIWMVLFFLMNLELPVLPSVAELREFLSDRVKSCKIENWTCSFPNPCSIKWKSKNKLTVEQLLQLFFIYYSDWQLKDYVLCTLTGSKIEKSYFFHNYDQLPSVFDDYKCKLKENTDFLNQIKTSFNNLCIQDPFDLSHNLTKNIGHKKFQIFNGLCKKTADIMESNIFS